MLGALAGCGGGSSPPASSSILAGEAQKTSFAEVRQAVDGLYRSHPAIGSFVVRNVEYTPKSRDKVLAVCRRGGAETNPASLESTRVLACAPLVFFFWSYGRRGVAESTDVARKLYWFAATDIRGPFDAAAALRTLLRRWGIT